LIYVLNRLEPSKCNLDGLKEEDNVKRAEKMIIDATSLGVPALVRPTDITTGNVKINTVFVSQLFNHKHGLEELTAEEYQTASMLDDDIEGSKEERSFRYWINSLNIDDVHV
jgi:plastin-1